MTRRARVVAAGHVIFILRRAVKLRPQDPQPVLPMPIPRRRGAFMTLALLSIAARACR